MHQTIHNKDFKIAKEDYQHLYQTALTPKLDALTSAFNQEILNEIVLWKVNRYASFTSESITLLNTISANDLTIDIELTKQILNELLKTSGVQLAMASTILRFKNPNLYQIIDQRVFRILYKDQELKFSSHKSEKNRTIQIDLYLKYLTDLKKACIQLDIPFHLADRVLYQADKRINKSHSLSRYGSR